MRILFSFMLSVVSIYCIGQNDTLKYPTEVKQKNLKCWNTTGSMVMDDGFKIQTYRFETSYRIPIFKKSETGIVAGYFHYSYHPKRANSMKKHDVFAGLRWKYQIVSGNGSPYLAFNALLDYSADYNLDEAYIAEEYKWSLGYTFLLDLGYVYRFKNLPYGIDISYSVGVNYIHRPSELGTYLIVSHDYYRSGMNFLKVGMNYYF